MKKLQLLLLVQSVIVTLLLAGCASSASAVGSVAGSAAGEAIERKVRGEDGLEVVVLLDHDETIAVVQGNDVDFDPGQRVQVLVGRDGSSRVQPL